MFFGESASFSFENLWILFGFYMDSLWILKAECRELAKRKFNAYNKRNAMSI